MSAIFDGIKSPDPDFHGSGQDITTSATLPPSEDGPNLGSCPPNSPLATTGGELASGQVRKDDLQAIQISESVEYVPLAKIKPAKINDRIYKKVNPEDAGVKELSKDMKAKQQVLEPLVITLDNTIVSGHRRLVAAMLAGFEQVPVRRINLLSTDPRFQNYLVAFNQQRVKSTEEQFREEIVRTSPDDAHLRLLAYRKDESHKAHKRVAAVGLWILRTEAARKRSEITSAKVPMLNAAIAVFQQYEDYWPLTVRQVHYRLLTRDFLRNAKTETKYENTQDCYKDLSDLLVRARENGHVPWESLHDPTRPRTDWVKWPDASVFMHEQLNGFLHNYHRDLLQSQPSYIELIVEKITVQEIAERAAGKYHVPVGVGRGYTSVTSLNDTAERFRASGKDRFILLIAGDFDPEGENICETWVNCLRDEHGVDDITAIKVELNPEQARQHNLSPLPIKESSSRSAGFKEKHGSNVYELEAFEPDQLLTIIQDAIRGVLDMHRFVAEQRKEAEEARYLLACQKQVQQTLRGILIA